MFALTPTDAAALNAEVRRDSDPLRTDQPQRGTTLQSPTGWSRPRTSLSLCDRAQEPSGGDLTEGDDARRATTASCRSRYSAHAATPRRVAGGSLPATLDRAEKPSRPALFSGRCTPLPRQTRLGREGEQGRNAAEPDSEASGGALARSPAPTERGQMVLSAAGSVARLVDTHTASRPRQNGSPRQARRHLPRAHRPARSVLEEMSRRTIPHAAR